jgi:Xaa-Pro aminopeptidase
MNLRRLTAILVALSAHAAASAAQDPRSSEREQRLFEWAALPFPQTEFRLRRQAIIAQLQQSGGGVLLLPSADGLTPGGTFRQQDNFLYFTGLELPRSILAIDPDASRAILFVPRRDIRFENPSRPNDFPGRPLADDVTLSRESGLSDIRSFSEFDSFISRAIADGRSIRIGAERSGPVVAGTDPFGNRSPAALLVRHLRSTYPSVVIQNAFSQIARLRMIKSEAEIAVMRRAASITSSAIMTAVRSVSDGMDERGLEAEFEAACKRGGSQRLAFSSIVKSGPNSLWPWRILAAHYDRRNRGMRNGELVIFDVGCEVDYYASDVGRTFPVSGEFTDEQREILHMTTAASDSVIAAVRPGMTFRELRAIALSAIPEEHRQYMQAELFFGHHVGLAVGDPSIPDVQLEPGMVFTVEPWYYNHDRDIAVFVEDEVLVTAGGAEVLTSALPRTPEDLENLVQSRR